MDQITATLTAAVAAASTSLVSLIVNIYSSRSSDLRAAHRKTLEPHINELAEAIHETVATSCTLLKTKSATSSKQWKNRSQVGKRKILEVRPKLRYPLWGITDELGLLARLPDWIAHAQKFPGHASRILNRGRSLGRLLDRSIKNSYTLGRPPVFFERIRIAYEAWLFRRSFDLLHKDRAPK